MLLLFLQFVSHSTNLRISRFRILQKNKFFLSCSSSWDLTVAPLHATRASYWMGGEGHVTLFAPMIGWPGDYLRHIGFSPSERLLDIYLRSQYDWHIIIYLRHKFVLNISIWSIKEASSFSFKCNVSLNRL